ncbi:uncharacterized protein L201_004905 [Kwoniella dendrophila CBS 6074]|uniref:Subtelomeric hrmA-associated cluster protein AFUB-079030/YDR124W-like helical bundle domain-containing protein n=1 Tax=Kwoniella dendrophila CBS 6074 TaxID=1295534 RepID=A0AAX4JXM8_9TREE
MPRIPVRTTPYHALPRCTRHYKSKRDLILRALGKASFINGSQFVIAWISPKGDTDIFASELLQSAVKDKESNGQGGGGGVLNKKELEKEAARVKQEMLRRWDEIRRMEEKGEAVPVLEEDQDQIDNEDENIDGGDEIDPDKTMVDEEIDLSLSTLETPLKSNGTGLGISSLTLTSNSKKLSPTMTTTTTNGGLYSTFPVSNSTPRSSTPASASASTTTTSSIPMQTITLKPDEIENFYMDRFTNLQQQTCKLVVKAWIKIIEPKKQMKFPYNKGEEFKPQWWPEGVKHREPDHLPKDERKLLLMSIIRNSSVNVARLQLSTAETSALISASKLAILREIYIVAKEEERRRQNNDTTSDLIIELPIVKSQQQQQLTIGNGSPEPLTGEKRLHSTLLTCSAVDNKENINYDLTTFNNNNGYHTTISSSKKQKTHPRLPGLTLSAQNQNQQQQHQPFGANNGGGGLSPYDSPYTTSPSPFAYTTSTSQQHLSPHIWGENRLSTSASSSTTTSAGGSHLSPYGYSNSDLHSDYSSSPNPELQQQQQQHPGLGQRQYSNQHHLAPILTHHQHHSQSPNPHSPLDSPAYTTQQPNSAIAPTTAAYYGRSSLNSGTSNGYMQQQQMEYLHQHHHQQQQQTAANEAYGFQSPYVTEQSWEGQYSQAA